MGTIVIPQSHVDKVEPMYDYSVSGNCEEWLYAVAKATRPTSFLEIGVRFAFSFLPVLYGAQETLKYAEGWDLETYGNLEVATRNIKEHYTGNTEWVLKHLDSQQISELPQFYDFVNIDGCHDYECKMHDLRLTVGHARYVLVDDFDYLTQVRKAILDFLAEVGQYGTKESLIEWAAYLPTFRGSFLFKYKA